MLTPEERRGALLVLALILIGAWWDATQGRRMAPPPAADRVEVRSAGADAADAPADSAAGARGPQATARVSLNRASAGELETLPGIGPVLARRIVEHRTRAGGFRSVDELRAVRGVGPRLLARLRGRVDL